MLTSICTVIVIVTISPQVLSRALFIKKKKKLIVGDAYIYKYLKSYPVHPFLQGTVKYYVEGFFNVNLCLQ